MRSVQLRLSHSGSQTLSGIWKEFKEFALRGNVIDLAVAFIMGQEFNKIVNSLVKDVIMPPIGYFIGGIDFTLFKLTLPQLHHPITGAPLPETTIQFGSFIQTVFSFTIVAIAVFTLVKAMNQIRRKEEQPPKPPEPPADVKLLTEIRDLLAKRQAS